MAEASPYMVLVVRVPYRELSVHMPLVADRDRRAEGLKNYLETLGLRPRYGCGTIEFFDDPASDCRTYRQTIPCLGVHGNG